MSLNLGLNVSKPQLNIGSMSFKPGLDVVEAGLRETEGLTGPISEGPGNKLKHSF